MAESDAAKDGTVSNGPAATPLPSTWASDRRRAPVASRKRDAPRTPSPPPERSFVMSPKDTVTGMERGTAGARVAEARDATAEKLDQAGQAVGEALREVRIDEFHLQGSVAGHPFDVALADRDGRRALEFDVNLESGAGDLLRIQGRKMLPEGALDRRSFEDAGRGLGTGTGGL